MSLDFGQLLTSEQKRALLEQRIAQFAAEGYQHTLNKQIAENTGNTEALALAENSIEIISAAIEAHQAELATLGE
jgi:hypothetical protein